MAFHDPLTNLYNRRYVDIWLPDLLGVSAGPTDVISVAFIDLDHFKRINDSLSHQVGDKVLRQFADLLADAAPAPAFVARMGGEEFLMVLPGTDNDEATRRCHALQHRIRTFDWTPMTEDIPVRASIGLVTAFAGSCAQAELLAEADRNLYAAKADGRDQTVVTDRTEEEAAAGA
jgi:diguanylate cyclase (GGDEF)-like protein